MQDPDETIENRPIEYLEKLRPRQDVSVQHQITDFVRGLIRSEKLSPGQKLPPFKVLAEMWGTTVYTVHTAFTPLAQEHLITSRQRLGTFVRQKQAELHTAGLYHSAPLTESTEKAFATQINTQVYQRLAIEGVQSMSWFDHRDPDTQTRAMAETRAALRTMQIQGLIATASNTCNLEWIRRLPVAMAVLTPHAVPGSVHLNWDKMIRDAAGALAARGCRRVGIMSPYERVVSYAESPVFLDEAKKLELETDPRWVVEMPESEVGRIESFGYEQFHKLWRSPERPEGLFLTSDVLARGALTAIVELGIDVPRELQLVVHRNAEIAVFCPFPVTWATVRVREIAHALIEQIRRQLRGEEALPIRVPVAMETNEP